MDIKDFTAITNKITQNLNNQALITELLTNLIDDYTEVQTNISNLQSQTQTYEQEIQNLQKTNMNLFLKVSSPTPDPPLQKTEPLKYDDLIQSMEA
jgi:C-terminal processing protease CtpA/Prc